MWTLRRLLLVIIVISSVAVVGTLFWLTSSYQRFAIDTQEDAAATMAKFLIDQRINKLFREKVSPFIDEWSRLSTLVTGMREKSRDKARIAADRMLQTLEVVEGIVHLRNVVVFS
jgi:type II secretory pathway pseudopilin PulG